MLSLLGSSLLAAFAATAAQAVRAEAKPDRVVVTVDGQPFTEYLFLGTEKYPYFYPVLGPRSGQSVTTKREKQYPHHSSIFFGCDKVSGGNYWQEGLERGRIVHQGLKLVQADGPEVIFEEDCRWERPGADAPFDDHRRIKISAPASDLRAIDFVITLKSRIKVRIDKTNHSLFSGRAAPDIAVAGGGTLINSQGDSGEKATFGKKSAWMDYRGKRGDFFEGLAIFDHPKNRWSPAPWFTRDYGFFSPTPMNWLEKGFLEIPAGESITLRYGVLIHASNPSREQLEAEFQRWAAQ